MHYLPDVSRYRQLREQEKVMHVTLEVPHSPSTVVRYLGQIDMMNYRAGNPLPRYEFGPAPDGGSLSIARAKKGGLTLLYAELPYEWVNPFWGAAELFFPAGPLAYLRLGYELRETEQGCLIDFYGYRTVRGTGFLAWLVARNFMNAVGRALQALKARALPPAEDPLSISVFTEEAGALGVDKDTLMAMFQDLHPDVRVGKAVADFLGSAPDKLAARIKPLQIAAHSKLPEIDLIEFFLRATRRGLFNLSWDLLCPSCRGDKFRASKLHDLALKAHCDYCNIEYDADFSRSVELTFRPLPHVRKVHGQSYCIHSPGNALFIHAQLNVWSDEAKTTRIGFPEESYSLRSPQFPFSRSVRIARDGPVEKLIDLDEELGKKIDEPLILGQNCQITLVQKRTPTATVKFYRRGYGDYALTAARVTAMQEFRDQFSAEALAPGLQIGVENLCFLFTDLKDSTPLYERLGDAPAFALVRDHFNVLLEEVRQNEGAVVKTIGDAVMAVFTSSQAGLSASLGIARRIASEHPAVKVKIGLHAGPCLAVNSNDTLDYFGATVNRAARIQGQAQGGDIVFSRELENIASVSLPEDFYREEFGAALKGITDDARLVRWTLKVS
ncbi:MAG: adenylate/guanylate cyclase domain-containing protein [Spirochaetales bacterium]|nr:adenylate/guanylate cyclase domain-containing protein [Spirochaetales bacterium]